jgi:PAS domain S-box-containing protein
MLKTATRFVTKFTRSLSFKLSFYTAFIMFLALLAFAYHSISAQEDNLITKMIQGALKDSDVIKAAIWNGMMTKDRAVIRQIVQTIGSQEGFKEINIYDVKGILHYTSKPDLANERLTPPKNPLLDDIGANTSVRHTVSQSGNSLLVVNPLLNEKSCSAASCHAHPESQKVLGALEVKLPLEGVSQEIAKTTRKTVVFAFLLFIFISTFSGLAVTYLVIPSIRRLQRRAAKMARGEYDPKGRSAGSDEMAELLRSFDKMSRQINERTAELAASRKLYKSLFEEAPCYLTVVSHDYRIVRANRTFLDQFGVQTGKHCFTGYKGLSSKCEECPVEKTFADGKSHQSEEEWQLDGNTVYVMVKTSPIFNDQGEVAEVLEMSVDVTRLKQLQLDLEKKQREFKYLFENVPCYLTVVDRDFNIVQTNKLFDQDFGNGLGRKCFKVYKRRESKCDNCPVEKTFLDGQTHNSQEIWRRNGEETHIIVYTAPITDQKGEIRAVMEMSTNITEVKRLESELTILGETIAGMSHSIKNILCGLEGGVYVLDSGLQRGKEDRVRDGWEMVKNNVAKVSELVKGILYASKEREPEYEECDPGRLLTEVCDLYEATAGGEGIQIVREFEKEMGNCFLDPAGIHSALSNLVSNAVEACRARDVAGHRITVSGRFEGGVLLMEVTDDGYGMPKEVKRKLFNRFYSTKGSKGTGLGLVITRKVIEEHGGTIRVESEPDRGTSFFIEIPLRSAQKPTVRSAAG